MTSNYSSLLEEAANNDMLDEEPDVEVDLLIPPTSDDSDLSDLRAILDRATASASAREQLNTKYKRLKGLLHSRHPDHELERAQLRAAINDLEEGVVWVTQASVALFHSQICLTCSSEHRYFCGWMTEQRHKADVNTRRLRKGKPEGVWPEKVEIHPQDHVDACANCVESCIAIDQATGRAT